MELREGRHVAEEEDVTDLRQLGIEVALDRDTAPQHSDDCF